MGNKAILQNNYTTRFRLTWLIVYVYFARVQKQVEYGFNLFKYPVYNMHSVFREN